MIKKLTYNDVRRMYQKSGIDKGKIGLYYYAFELYESGTITIDVFIMFLGRYLEMMKAYRHQCLSSFSDEIKEFIVRFPYGKRITEELFLEKEKLIKNYVSVLYSVTGTEIIKLKENRLPDGSCYLVYKDKYIYLKGHSTDYAVRCIFKDADYVGLTLSFFDFWEDIALLDLSENRVYKKKDKKDKDAIQIFNSRNEMYRSLVL